VTRAQDASSARAPWLLLLGEEEVVSADLATEIAQAVEGRASATAYRIGQDVEALGTTPRLPGAPIRLARRDGATLHAKTGLLALRPRIGPIHRLRGRLVAVGAGTLEAAMAELDADSDALAAVLYACGAQPRLRHLATLPLVPGMRALVARSPKRRRPHWALAVFSGYRTAVAYAKLWELRRAEGSLGR